jgi:hypothetical protein
VTAPDPILPRPMRRNNFRLSRMVGQAGHPRHHRGGHCKRHRVIRPRSAKICR